MTKIRTFYPSLFLALFLALAGLAFTAAPAFACGGTVICVDDDAPAGGNGQSWGTAYKYLQDALAAATSGNEIWVAEGVYYPDEGAGQTAGNQAASFFLKSGVAIYGGFAATETLRTQRDWDTHITVLSGDLAGDDTADGHGVVLDWENVVGTDNTYQIVTAGYYNWGSGLDVTVDATAVLDGFTITAGRDFRDATLQGIGAGLLAYKSNPTLRHLVFSGNQAKVGGGIYLWGGDYGPEMSGPLTMTDLTFTGSVATQGGGLYCRFSSLTLDQFLFQNNETRNLTAAAQMGGGMATGACDQTLTHGQFIGNTAGSAGGLSTGGPVSLSHVIFDSNRATEGNTGAGGMVSEGGNPVLADVTFVNNSSNGWGGGYYHQNSALSLSRVSFIGNVTTWSYGGGLAAVYAPTVITDAFFAGNVASGGWGSGMLLQGQSMTMTNAVFQGNGSDGLTLYSGATAALQNVTVAGNGGMGINLVNASNLQVSNSIIYGNGGGMSGGSGVSVTYSIVGGGCPGGAICDHVTNTDPLFVLPVVQSAVPTSTGDLRLRATSPAIDAGDNSAVPAGLTTDLDGNPRLVDTPAVADTGSGTPPIVDMGAYEFMGRPDLEVSKANNVGGAVAANTPFSWTLTISNTGGDTATFGANTVILQDDLPSANASYGSPTIQNAAGLSGPINCTISAYTLTCRANGGPVTLAAAGQFTVAIPVNTSGIPILVNPRSGGVCRVDPNNVISELLENNNTCNSDTVAVGQTTLTVAIHDAGHTPIVQAPIGAMIHAAITVTGVGAPPTGATHLYRYNNSTCSGSPTNTNNQNLVNGAVESAGFAATSFYYRVLYSGDSTHESVYSPCTQFRAYQTGPTFTVNTPADDDIAVDGFMCSDIHCTLREAILAANAATGANTILFDIGSGQTITLTLALPAINDAGGELTINGQTYDVTVSGADQYRLFTVSNNARATLAYLTLVHGNYTGGDCSNGPCGGGLKVEAGSAVTLTHSAILSSTATNQGGGIHNAGGLTIQQSTLAGNSAQGGGGIYNAGTLIIQQSTLAGNSAQGGGGLLLSGGSLTLENSTLSGNSATGTDSLGGGGAIDLYNGAGVISSSTIVSNTAVSPNQAKSGIWLENGTLSLHNSIVAANNGANNFYRTGGTFTSQGYNLANAWNGLSGQSTDLTGDPKLGPLADNGGPLTGSGQATLTHMPLTGSPAIDGGDPGGCPAADQRDIARPQGLRCDIGAVEGTASLWMTKSVVPAGNVPYHGVVTYTIVLTNAGGAPAANLSLTDTLPAGLAFGQWLQQPGSGLVQTGGAITWTGTLAANTALPLSFTATHTGNSFDVITNIAFFSGALQNGSAAATFNVLCLNTITVQNANDSGPGSLRQAIADVCDGGTIDFAAGLAGQTLTLTSAELTIVRAVTITNPNASGLAISGNNARRVFSIQATGVVTLSHLSIISGTVLDEGGSGGGIRNYGTLSVVNSTLAGNSATKGYGGGIRNSGTLSVVNSTLAGNSAGVSGGGIYNNGTLNVVNSTLSGNSATSGGGGGIFNGGTLSMQNSTLAGNSAPDGYGGGILNADTLNLANTLIANSLSGGDCSNYFGHVGANDHNLIEDNGNACDLTDGVGGSIVGLDPLLAPLDDHGGSTQTFALLPGSPALNAGAGCLATDQRGIARPQGAACDIGAFESRGFNVTYGSGSDQSTLIHTVFANPLALTISSSYSEPVENGQVIFTAPGSGASTHPAVYTATISGGAVTQVVTANNTVGSYVVTATAWGNLGSPASYALTNIAPEIAVLGNGVEIASGDTTPDPADHTNFGSAVVAGGQITRTFTISNSGGANLNLTGTPLISITGPAALDFSLVLAPTTPLPPNETATFQVRFDPSLAGTEVATVTIASDDSDENPYNFAIQGTGTIPVVQFSQAVYQVNEDGTAAGAAVALIRTGLVDVASQVEVSFADDTATGGGIDYTSDPLTITFPAGSTEAQTVTVPINQDFMVELAESLTMTVTSLNNAQIGSQGTAVLQIVDDDSAGVLVSPGTALTISEPGGSDTFNIRLTSQPTATVTIDLTVSDSSACSVAPDPVTLTDVTWQTGVTVTVVAVDDFVTDGPQECRIVTAQTSSSDPVYDTTFNPDDVIVTVNDDDMPDIRVSPTTGLTTTETGSTSAFTVRLGSQPTAPVTITLTSSDTTEGVISPAALIFGLADWQLAQTVTVTGMDDLIADGNQPYTIQTHPASSSDGLYNGRDPADVSLVNLDDDSAGFNLNPASLTISEPAGVATFTLKLTSQPVATVTANLTVGDATECGISPNSTTLDATNWQMGVTITVTAVDDDLVDGDQPCGVSGLFNSGDGNYHNRAFNLMVTVKDDDVSPIYLPLIMSGFTSAVTPGPDLVIDSLSSSSSGPQVVIHNAGSTPVSDAFWVDVYFNPNPAPPPLNRTWQSIAPYGAHWGVTQSLAPGESLTLTLGGPYYAGGSSSFPADLPVYAYVDSINYATTYGNVRESSEANNVFGPVVSAAGPTASAAYPEAKSPEGLPGR